MNEIRDRLDLTDRVIKDPFPWYPLFLQEFCYLQLRLICESIALGCLVAHGDIKNKSTLKKWSAADIFSGISELGEDYFPKPVTINHLDNGSINLDPITLPYAHKSDVLRIWKKAGNFLHRGSEKSIRKNSGKIIPVDINKIIRDFISLKNLLETHFISSADRNYHLIVSLAHDQTDGRCGVWLATHLINDDSARII